MTSACESIGRVWAVVQPHTYSRVKTLFNDYLTCTTEADFTLVTDIFGAREADPGDIDAGMLVEGMKKTGVNAVWTPSFEDAAAIRRGVQAGDLVITMDLGYFRDALGGKPRDDHSGAYRDHVEPNDRTAQSRTRSARRHAQSRPPPVSVRPWPRIPSGAG